MGAPAREVCRHLKSLKEVLRLSGSRYGYVGLGDESGAEWMPLLLPWSASGDGEFKPENVLKKLGAHPHLGGTIIQEPFAIQYEPTRKYKNHLQNDCSI